MHCDQLLVAAVLQTIGGRSIYDLRSKVRKNNRFCDLGMSVIAASQRIVAQRSRNVLYLAGFGAFRLYGKTSFRRKKENFRGLSFSALFSLSSMSETS